MPLVSIFCWCVKRAFQSFKSKQITSKYNIIRALNLDYLGPIDGHDLNGLLKELTQLKDKKGPKLIHVLTTKGKGLYLAERNQVKYHAPGKFDAKTGKLTIESNKEVPLKYQEVFGKTMVELAKKNAKIVGITPAMLTGSSLKMMAKEFPKRTFDVGISEQHAVTFSAGMATQGMIPFCNIYSTFIQTMIRLSTTLRYKNFLSSFASTGLVWLVKTVLHITVSLTLLL